MTKDIFSYFPVEGFGAFLHQTRLVTGTSQSCNSHHLPALGSIQRLKGWWCHLGTWPTPGRGSIKLDVDIRTSPRLISGDSDQPVLFSPEPKNTKNSGILPHSLCVDLSGFCQCHVWCSVWFNHSTGNKSHHRYKLFVSGPLEVRLTFDPSD